MREVGFPRSGRYFLTEIDERDRDVSVEDRVERAQIAVTDDLFGASERARGGPVMEVTDQVRCADDPGVTEPERWSVGHGARYVAQDLSALLVVSEEPGRTVEADVFELGETARLRAAAQLIVVGHRHPAPPVPPTSSASPPCRPRLASSPILTGSRCDVVSGLGLLCTERLDDVAARLVPNGRDGVHNLLTET